MLKNIKIDKFNDFIEIYDNFVDIIIVIRNDVIYYAVK